MTPETWAKLREPFDLKDVEWRIGRSSGRDGRVSSALAFAYITRSAVYGRFDEVLGPENVQVEFVEWRAHATKCRISLFVDGKWIAREDVGVETDMEPIKGGATDALKRTASAWGVGRYLYYLPEGWVTLHPEADKNKPGVMWASHNDKKTNARTNFWWSPPALPEWARRRGVDLTQERELDMVRELIDAHASDPPYLRALYAGVDEYPVSDATRVAMRVMITEAGKRAAKPAEKT